MREQLSSEKARLERLLGSISQNQDEYIDRGVLLIELVQHTERTYKKATPDVKRKIIEIVSSNQVLRDGTIEFDYRKPFDLLASASSKEKWWTLAAEYRNFFAQNPWFNPAELGFLKAA